MNLGVPQRAGNLLNGSATGRSSRRSDSAPRSWLVSLQSAVGLKAAVSAGCERMKAVRRLGRGPCYSFCGTRHHRSRTMHRHITSSPVSLVRSFLAGYLRNVNQIWQGNRSTGRKPAPVPLCPSQIPHDLTWDRARAAACQSCGTAHHYLGGPRQSCLSCGGGPVRWPPSRLCCVSEEPVGLVQREWDYLLSRLAALSKESGTALPGVLTRNVNN
jgi:hypothetical protein